MYIAVTLGLLLQELSMQLSVTDCLLTHKHFVVMPHFIPIFLSDVAGQSLFLIHVTDSCFLISYLDQIEIT